MTGLVSATPEDSGDFTRALSHVTVVILRSIWGGRDAAAAAMTSDSVSGDDETILTFFPRPESLALRRGFERPEETKKGSESKIRLVARDLKSCKLGRKYRSTVTPSSLAVVSSRRHRRRVILSRPPS